MNKVDFPEFVYLTGGSPIYSTREEAKAEIFNFVEMFYNPVKRHSHTGGISPPKFEKAYFERLAAV
jgi:putative transposase